MIGDYFLKTLERRFDMTDDRYRELSAMSDAELGKYASQYDGVSEFRKTIATLFQTDSLIRSEIAKGILKDRLEGRI